MTDQPKDSPELLDHRKRVLLACKAFASAYEDVRVWVGDPADPQCNHLYGYFIELSIPIEDGSHALEMHVQLNKLPFTAHIESEVLVDSGGDDLSVLRKYGDRLSQLNILGQALGCEWSS